VVDLGFESFRVVAPMLSQCGFLRFEVFLLGVSLSML